MGWFPQPAARGCSRKRSRQPRPQQPTQTLLARLLALLQRQPSSYWQLNHTPSLLALRPTPPTNTTVFDGYAGWDPEARFKIRVVCARPYHALFMHNMLIRCGTALRVRC